MVIPDFFAQLFPRVDEKPVADDYKPEPDEKFTNAKRAIDKVVQHIQNQRSEIAHLNNQLNAAKADAKKWRGKHEELLDKLEAWVEKHERD